jgi:O-antigen ligase
MKILNTFNITSVYQSMLFLLAFTLPLSKKIVPVLVVFLVVSAVFFYKRISFIKFKNIKLPLLFILFYLLHVIGLFYSSNSDYALFDLEVKASLLIFPLVLSFTPALDKENLSKVINAFIQGCFIAIMICFIAAVYRYQYTAETLEFFYGRFSVFHHAGYFAMYLNFAVAALVIKLFDSENSTYRKVFYMVLLALFSLVIFLLASRAGILIYLLIFSGTLFFLIYLKMYFRFFLVLAIAGALTALVISHSGYTVSRIMLMKESLSNSEVAGGYKDGRLYVWEASTNIIKNNLLIGVGTGDVKDVLKQELNNLGYKKPVDLNLNSHNQYLQSAIAIGVPSVLLLISIMLFLFILSIIKRFFLYAAFLVILAISMLFESVLETQAGVVFYAFFNSLLFFSMVNFNQKNIQSHQIKN